MSARPIVLLYTKPAVPGRVKTRLIGTVTSEQAAQLHAAFLEDVTMTLEGTSAELQIAWALEDGESLPETSHPGFRQEGQGLGERLWNGLSLAAERAPLVAAVGSDHPEMPASRLEEAFRRLRGGADVVLGPAEDGGYYLVAVRREGLRQELFDGIPWSTSGVLAATLERADALGLSVELLEEGTDVDDAADLERLAALLATEPALCPSTSRLLQGWREGSRR